MATQIGEIYSGHWNDWQQASRLNSSFGYGSPTNLGAIGMGAIGIAGDPYLAQGTLQSPQGFPNLGAIGIAGDPYEAQGTLQSPPGYPNLGAIGMGMLGGADLPQDKKYVSSAPVPVGDQAKGYMTRRQAAMAREKMGLSTSRSAASAALARERKEAHSCRVKLRRLANEYQTLQGRYRSQNVALTTARGDRDSARRRAAALHHRINSLTQQLAECEARANYWRRLVGQLRRGGFR